MQAGALSVVFDGQTVTVRGITARIIRRLLEPALRQDLERPGQTRQVVAHIKDGAAVIVELKRFYIEDA